MTKLLGVHPDLVKVILEAQAQIPFRVTEGLRSLERQKQLLAEGKTKTLDSRHLTGHAVDVVALVDGKVSWDFPHYQKIANVVKHAAASRCVPIVWGGDWQSLKDGPHFELDRKAYP